LIVAAWDPLTIGTITLIVNADDSTQAGPGMVMRTATREEWITARDRRDQSGAERPHFYEVSVD